MPLPEPIRRPIVDPSICEPNYRVGGELGDERWNPFSRSSDGPISIQIIGDHQLGPAGPYGMLLRYTDRSFGVEGRETEPIGDWDVAVEMVPNGNSHLFWNLPDGGEGYLRSRGLDREAVVGIVGSLTARDAAAGFDYQPASDIGGGLELTEEGTWGSHDGWSAAIECTDPDHDAIYRIATMGGTVDAIVEYAFVSDRPVPLEVGYQGDTLVVINGYIGNDADPPTVADVFNADEATWTAIPEQPTG
ncbi:MAG: hypothetical protein ABIP17_08640 [Ilumatobacteraceae bacterium]